jgi:glutamyl-tRNA synthetase
MFHVGSARTALMNWMLARATGGTFLVRVEDTSAARSTKDSLEDILTNLEVLGLTPDAPVRIASDHTSEHVAAAHALVAHSSAYFCTCMSEDVLARGVARGYDGFCRDLSRTSGAVRFKNPGGRVSFTDAVSGDHDVDAGAYGDFALVRASGDPLFVLQNTFDDAATGVTWVVRGADHLANNGRYVLLWDAFVRAGVVTSDLPAFAHLPLIMGPSGKKLSKRRDKVALSSYFDDGILPSALLTYLSSLGWGAPDGLDRARVEDLAQHFDVTRVSVSNAVMDPVKLRAINADHMRDLARTDPSGFEARVQAKAGAPWPLVASGLVEDVATRAETLNDVVTLLAPVFSDAPLDEASRAKWLKPAGLELVSAYLDAYADPALPWDAVALEAHARDLAADRELGLTKATMPVRVAVLRSARGLPLFSALAAMERGAVLARLKAALDA